MADSEFLSTLDDPTLFVGPHDRVRRLFWRARGNTTSPPIQAVWISPMWATIQLPPQAPPGNTEVEGRDVQPGCHID
jgi:hypothetical protein